MRKGIVAFTAVCLALVNIANAEWKAELESGTVFSDHNDVRIPNKTGTSLSLTDDLDSEAEVFFRARLSFSWNRRHVLSLLVAPLTIKSNGEIGKNVFFEGVEFPAGSMLGAEYKFNSYRLTYRYSFYDQNNITAGIGFTAKIRDAGIILENGTLRAEKTNVGFVPLLNFRFTARLTGRLSLELEGDALAAPQGRAEDIAAFMVYRPVDRLDLKAGYRLLEGGADVDEVYNFALLHYLAFGLSLRI